MQSDVDYDVIIVGGGMVGSMLAAALARQSRFTVAVLEQQAPAEFEPGSEPEYDIRVSALSIATQRMLENVGAWSHVIARRACPFRQMRVWDGEETGSTHFRAQDIGSDVLGHIVENRVLQLALLDVIREAERVDYHCPADLQAWHRAGERVVCELADGQGVLTTRLLVGADGGRSTVREAAGIAVERSAYEHHALVATVETVLSQQDITWQRFQPTGPEAMLPLCGNRASLVWYHDAEHVAELREMDDSSFLSTVQARFPTELGGLTRVLERGSFPIVRAHACRYVADRLALIGDAAHIVHPLAGQGVNLGMLDSAALAEVLTDAADRSQDPGQGRVLRRYERWRRGENALMMSVLDGFYHAFRPRPAGMRRLRSLALDIADHAGPVKSLVMQQAMGTAGDLPRLARSGRL